MLKNIEEKVQNLLEPTIKELNYDLYDVEYVKEGKDYFLRIYIDNKKGISLEDCEKVSNAINEILDKVDLIQEQYFLEVSSPGIERILRKEKHFEDNLGKEIIAKLFKQYDGKKQIIGILDHFDNNYIYIKEQEKILNINKKDISQIKTVYNWE